MIGHELYTYHLLSNFTRLANLAFPINHILICISDSLEFLISFFLKSTAFVSVFF